MAIDLLTNPNAEPLQVATTAASLAMSAIDQRRSAADADETTDAFDAVESQLIAGRVVGVVMRMRELEGLLARRVGDAGWVTKYGEEGSFGVLGAEGGGCDGNSDDGSGEGSSTTEAELAEAIASNPLLRMNRAECLLALFLETVERPKLEGLGEEHAAVDGSRVDFVDADRLGVLVP